ncbi:hypothetical protein PQU92_02300 [Asticcacaulis sp. BYS171W]|uniref:Uncharacterized protein n=1 Tax=Asticcacaulis aquaticus TaxID=2984212 RepID=A0ABT5HQ70_9CAUL|nr:hypothetical protein [Asticcacaulis aquaticus]MDC7682087.1 hypothetical protein [Asticcacaulis aquaticus]
MSKPHHLTIYTTALCILIAAAPLHAAEFGDESARVWTERNLSLFNAATQNVPTSDDLDASEAAGNAYFGALKTACSGISGEHIRYGGKNMPVWAQTAQQRFCLGADNLRRAYSSGKKDKKYCGDLKSAISYAQKADAAKNPPAIMASSQKLIEASEALMNSRITLVKKSILGDSKIVFSCS